MIRIRYAAIALLSVAMTSAVNAAPIVAGVFELGIRAVQDITLPANSPLNPTSADILLTDVTATGMFSFTREAQVGTSLELTNGEFVGLGSDPRLSADGMTPIQFKLFSGLAEGGTNPLTATLSSIVQDPADTIGDPASLLSADGSFIVPDFGFEFLSGPNTGAKLEVRDEFLFSVQFDGLPPSENTLFTSTDVSLDGFLAGTNVVAARSSNRRLFATAVPEPTSFAMLAAVGSGWWIRRQRRSTKQNPR